jgi:hypothetical protein
VALDPQEPNTVLSPGGQAFIDVKAGTQLGTDNFVRTYDPDLDTIVVTQVGNRLFTLTVKFESYEANVHAHEVLETLRLRLERNTPAVRGRLRAQGMTVVSTEAVQDLPTTYDNRVISVSALDVKMALRFSEASTAWLAELTGDRLDSVGGLYEVTRNTGESYDDYRVRVQAAVALDEGNYIETVGYLPDVT